MDSRPTYKPKQESEALISRIIEAHPLMLTGLADVINYALRFCVAHDPALAQPMTWEETQAKAREQWRESNRALAQGKGSKQ